MNREDAEGLPSIAPAAAGPLLELRGISKHFAGVAALQDVDLDLYRGQILAVAGENGAGKSTLMKILAGVHRPDAGHIRLGGASTVLRTPQDALRLGISTVYQEFSLVPHLNAVENMFLGHERTKRCGVRDHRAMQREARRLLDRLGATVRLDVAISELSVADRQFVEIAKALLHETRILILDEPTATLTPTEANRLFAVMRDLKAGGVALIFISHHLGEIFTICDDILCLRDGRVVGTRPVAGCKEAELIRMMVGRDVAHAFPAREPSAALPVLLEATLRLGPQSPEIRLHVCAGEILGIAGLVGAGRTEMVRALIGADHAAMRDVRLDGRPLRIRSPADARAAGIGLVPEDRALQGLVLGASVMDNLLLAGLRKVSHRLLRHVRAGLAKVAAARLVGQLAIRTHSLAAAVRNLSGGNQQKVVLGKWLHAGCRVLILDEPTRGIDVAAKAEIHRQMRALTAQGMAVIMISSELPEVLGLSDRVIVMRGQGITRSFERGDRPTAEDIFTYAGGACHG